MSIPDWRWGRAIEVLLCLALAAFIAGGGVAASNHQDHAGGPSGVEGKP